MRKLKKKNLTNFVHEKYQNKRADEKIFNLKIPNIKNPKAHYINRLAY